ncbi:phosphodiesterase [Shewanella sp. D64]|uniref:phosphodiesterase n=1 Tax=unclassified Shewanella TaxID=196818 RepID=UPI0022BA2B4A|nr:MULTISPECIES: phosphodiesterase [unclassified Shewanella]MEC4725186.1 phosphodiesterase [Shewanella sp. D64]MEC4737087.1 phosphodiesterase [Shewanella sp. E94]WBJ96672.1 phosphodiesterase [Shewanella sp. MTB7]
MKLFFASDIHGCFESAQRMMAAFEQSGAQHLLLLGDILNHGPRNAIPQGYAPLKVVELLNAYGDKIVAVRGNCDSEVDQMLLNFPMMADYNWVLLPDGRRLFLTHGHLYRDDNSAYLNAGDIIASGHTHLAVAEKLGEIILFNPGSVTIPRGEDKASYGLLEDNRLSVMTFDGDEISSCMLD